MKKTLLIIVGIAILYALPTAFAAKTSPLQRPRSVRVGKASWYSEKSPGVRKNTANNEIFNDNEMTCAIWGVRFNKKIKVTNLANGKSLIVRVNDRGPHERYVRKGRIIDLTKAAFERLGSSKDGLMDVRLEFL